MEFIFSVTTIVAELFFSHGLIAGLARQFAFGFGVSFTDRHTKRVKQYYALRQGAGSLKTELKSFVTITSIVFVE